MKKFSFYFAIAALTIIFWLIFGAILALIVNGTNHFSYALGAWCGKPYVVLLALGVAFLFRGQLYRCILNENKQFNSKVALYIIAGAIVWGGWMIGVRSFYEYAQNKALNEYYQQQ